MCKVNPCSGRILELRRIPTTNPAAVKHTTRKATARMPLNFMYTSVSSIGTTADVTLLEVEETATAKRTVAVLYITAVIARDVAVRKRTTARATTKLRPVATGVVNVPSNGASAVRSALLRKHDMVEREGEN